MPKKRVPTNESKTSYNMPSSPKNKISKTVKNQKKKNGTGVRSPTESLLRLQKGYRSMSFAGLSIKPRWQMNKKRNNNIDKIDKKCVLASSFPLRARTVLVYKVGVPTKPIKFDFHSLAVRFFCLLRGTYLKTRKKKR